MVVMAQLSFRQVVIASFLVSASLNLFFFQHYIGNRLYGIRNSQNSPENYYNNNDLFDSDCCPSVCKKCETCQIPNSCEVCQSCLESCPCQCLACCPKIARDPIPRSEVRQLDLLHAIQSDLLEYRKGKDYQTIHDWNPISFVINLKNRTDRRDSFFKMFDSHNIPPSLIPRPLIFEAVNSKAMPADQLWKYNGDGKEWVTLDKGVEYPGGYGCYLSHIEVLKMMLEKYPGKDLVLFEDDALFYSNDFVKRLTNTFNNIPTNWDMFYIGGTLWTRPVDMAKFSFKFVDRMGNTQAVLFRARSIESVLRFVSSAPGRLPIDILYGNYLEETSHKAYCPDIPLAAQTSSISNVYEVHNENIQKANEQNNQQLYEKWGGGWWRKNSSIPCGDCVVEQNCACG